MAGLRRRLNSVLSAHFPEKRLFIQSGDSTRYLRLTPLLPAPLGHRGACRGRLDGGGHRHRRDRPRRRRAPAATQAVVIQDAYRTRLEELAAERDQRAAEARSAQDRFQVAMEQISRQQTAILQSVEERRELATALDLMRDRLQDARRPARRRRRAPTTGCSAQMNAVSATLNRAAATGADLTETLRDRLGRARRRGGRRATRRRRARRAGAAARRPRAPGRR